jgi:copper ion binding protein
MVKQVFRVTDMHCSNCVMRIEGLEDDLNGVQRVRASYKKQQVEVEYDDNQVSADQIVAAIQQMGYTVG